MTATAGFAARIVRWQRAHGRSGLPWQQQKDPYRVWLSEVMLQQTQVVTVLDYYPRFLARFPDVAALARANEDDVLALWSGLGYYSRARNLHRCAQAVVAEHGGAFPRTAEALATLPGIGRSTAAAIAAFCFGERAAILDGNVKRVLARVLAFGEDLATQAATRKLWDHAEALLPTRRLAQDMPAYTQGLMDLGATVCLPRHPVCDACPVSSMCAARQAGNPDAYPVRSRKLRRTSESLWLLHARTPEGHVWLEKRPPRGVWAGLYCLPVFGSAEALAAAVPHAALKPREPLVHALTHKDLHLHPVSTVIAEGPGRGGAWHAMDDARALGLPAPVRKLLSELSPGGA